MSTWVEDRANHELHIDKHAFSFWEEVVAAFETCVADYQRYYLSRPVNATVERNGPERCLVHLHYPNPDPFIQRRDTISIDFGGRPPCVWVTLSSKPQLCIQIDWNGEEMVGLMDQGTVTADDLSRLVLEPVFFPKNVTVPPTDPSVGK